MKLGSTEAVAFGQNISALMKREEAVKPSQRLSKAAAEKKLIEIRATAFRDAVAEVYGGRYMENLED